MTDPRLFERARALFERVCDLDGAARESALGDSDHETATLVRELLAADAGLAERLESSPVAEFGARLGAQRLPERIGAFTILERIGAGTTGVVYRARQDSPAREVALKVVRSAAASADTLRRFANEAEVLARLDHPGIAKVFEAGTSDTGHGAEPWFAMELVDGVPLNSFVREQAPARDAVVRLVADVADAVHHAHQRGIVHRDLKPANVLVRADGRPKVLDFGLARAVVEDGSLDSMHTRTGDVLGTLAYMSPEQLLGSGTGVDARSDVYALGVLAYEALCGALPLDVGGLSLPEAARVVESREPARLGTRARELGGDLETVVAKALEKERGRRYASAADFAADLRRVLADEPIEARPPSAWYQATKFARRNRGFVLGIVTVFVVLVGGVVASTSLYFDKERQRRAAVDAKNDADEARANEHDARVVAEDASQKEREARVAAEAASKLERAVFGEFMSLITAATPWTMGKDVLLADALEAAAERARETFPDQPLLRVEFLANFATAFFSLGDWERARLFGDEAHALAVASGTHPLRVLELEMSAALAAAKCGDPEAVETLRQAIATAESLGAPPIMIVRAMTDLVEEVEYRGGLEEALVVVARALELVPSIADEYPETAFRVHKLHGDTLMRVGRYTESEVVLQAAAVLARTLTYEYEEIMCLNSLASCALQLGRPEEARTLLTDVVARMRAIGAEEHPHFLTQLSNLATVEGSLGNLDEAVARMRELAELAHRTEAAPSRNEAITLSNLVEAERRRGNHQEAMRVADTCRPLLVAALGEASMYVVNADVMRGKAYLDGGRVADAIASLTSGITGKRTHIAEDHASLADDFLWLAQAQLAAGEHDQALVAAHGAVERGRAPAAGNPGFDVLAGQTLAMATALCGRTHEAVPLAQAALDDARERLPRSWLLPRGEAVIALCEALSGADAEALARYDAAFERVVAVRSDPEGPNVQRLIALRAAVVARLAASEGR